MQNRAKACYPLGSVKNSPTVGEGSKKSQSKPLNREENDMLFVSTGCSKQISLPGQDADAQTVRGQGLRSHAVRRMRVLLQLGGQLSPGQLRTPVAVRSPS